MRIIISPEGDLTATTLGDPENFREFSVEVVPPTTGAELAAAVERIGVMDDDHVFVSPAALKQLAGVYAEDPSWQTSLAGMIGYAESAGWVDASGRIRAHVEWRPHVVGDHIAPRRQGEAT